MGKAKRAVLYLRVSTSGQTVENQRRELLNAAERHGWTVVGEFRDSGISGKNGREKRPGYDRLCAAVARRECELVAAWSVDRLGRSLQDLVGFLGELHAKKVDLYLHQQGVDTSTPAGKALFQMMGVFAEFERAIIVERINAGLARAKANGVVLGRPKIRARDEERARKELAKGTGVLKTAKLVGIGTGTVQRIKREMASEHGRRHAR
jgi:DNA invertase Pin-like site-specific DNA recombinase